jgi:diphosphomevalonate decarboxylase
MTSYEAVAVAHPNVALSKYWGKRRGTGNLPAVPSLSITLSPLRTRTCVRWSDDRPADRVVLDGRELQGPQADRVVALLDRVRRAVSLQAHAEVESENDFPTASGLASSASGFAALALAAVPRDRDWDATRISDLARRSSASAARSVFGGFVELDAGPPGGDDGDESSFLCARSVAPPEHLPLVVLVCVTTENAKAVSSTEGMRVTMERSPFARAWLEHAPRLHAQLRDALLARDFERLGELSEASALAMHATSIAAGVRYWNAATLAVLDRVRALRQDGLLAYATVDAGPHVKVLVRPNDAAAARAAIEAASGVLRVIEATPGEGARFVKVVRS